MIALEGVTVRYGGRPPVLALAGLSLCLQPGVTLVRGPSGAGKSTLLRVLAGLQPPAAGAVRYPWPAAHTPGRTGYLPQENRLTQTLSAEGALRYLAGVRGLRDGRRAVARLLAHWGLEPQRRTPLCRLSCGEARRWLLAQSQLLDPDLWLLDEPLHGLDAWGVATLRAELASYGQAVRYAVLVSHDARLDGLAGAIVRLERGRLATP
jgi:ABC-type multidrug transport system ATPase subunit